MESFSLNPLKRRQQLGISNTYFTNKNAEYPPSPTDQGWFLLYPDTWVFAEKVEFSNSIYSQ